jgi:putative toxin-antitoxin system antitoxin component (TIGR02293 family)
MSLTEAQRSEIQSVVESYLQRIPIFRPGGEQVSAWPTTAAEPMVRVIARAVEVLGTSEKALRWLNAPVRSLGDQPPMSLLGSPEGIARVEDALGRIEHGVW